MEGEEHGGQGLSGLLGLPLDTGSFNPTITLIKASVALGWSDEYYDWAQPHLQPNINPNPKFLYVNNPNPNQNLGVTGMIFRMKP